jgi:hypothetical protein
MRTRTASWRGRSIVSPTAPTTKPSALCGTAAALRSLIRLLANLLGSIYPQQGKKREAQRAFEEAIRIAPTFPETHWAVSKRR